MIYFNGKGEDGHETFCFSVKEAKREGSLSNFCKTARKPYDIVVCEVLLILKDYFKEDLEVSSDGSISINSTNENWGKAIDEVTNMGIDIIPLLVAEKI